MTARRFTGRHMLAAMLGFFGIIIAVNFTMAWFASSTFGGTVVDNSYVASQKYNQWLAAARAQEALGWTVAMTLDPARHVEVTASLPATRVTGTATHPLGRLPEQALAFVQTGEGRYRATTPLPPGRYLVRIIVDAEGTRAGFQQDVPA
ncbi:cytochrome oxidase [Polymorphobacter multimanifer]|uniref:Nitrogen fixation protein FixH n=1 Tax=Polymorphobacter multimanifer TaxID=1070431 RepID=A0A841L896_9SPHN|nr:FixH family protein [Polymorphobacter multimanifer]MBB6227183.1 nitrogen fixation protein FixH [Polymorphobacter multimanifer]GGI72272.1 cytochrome oxidase [Polymorphobacter multimanifer]